MPNDERDEQMGRPGPTEPIPDTVENVARAIMQEPPKSFLDRRRRAREPEADED